MTAQDQSRIVPLPPERSLALAGPREGTHAGSAGWFHAGRSHVARPANDAAFIVQLLACRDDVAAYRRFRRVEPCMAQARYMAAMALVGDAA